MKELQNFTLQHSLLKRKDNIISCGTCMVIADPKVAVRIAICVKTCNLLKTYKRVVTSLHCNYVLEQFS